MRQLKLTVKRRRSWYVKSTINLICMLSLSSAETSTNTDFKLNQLKLSFEPAQISVRVCQDFYKVTQLALVSNNHSSSGDLVLSTSLTPLLA